jgi:hypothetical protein
VNDVKRSAREEAFLEMRRQPRLNEDEIAEHLARAMSVHAWEALAPWLSVGRRSPAAGLEEAPIDETQRADLARRLAREGYLQTGPVIAPSVIAGMRRAMEALRDKGWPPVFAYVYDQFWEIARAPSLTALFNAALGPGYRQSPRVWAFHLATAKGSAGWPPHVDGGHRTHTPDRLTLWLPISDATLENGCMYVLPKHLVPASIPDDFANNAGVISPEVWRTMLQGCRALPAKAGSVLAWDFQVIHWSSLCDGAAEPRMSLAVELIGASAEPADSELPLLDPGSLPPFAERLRAIANGVLSYQRFEPAALRYAGLARRMLERLDLEMTP